MATVTGFGTPNFQKLVDAAFAKAGAGGYGDGHGKHGKGGKWGPPKAE